MDSSRPAPQKYRRRAWLVAAAVGGVAVVVVSAVATGGFGLANSRDHTAPSRTVQDRCESDVLGQLPSPSKARLSNVKAETAALDPDTKDFSSLHEDPLKGVNHSRITVLNISGVVNIDGDAFGNAMRDPFSCRAYFIDNNLVHILVAFDHEH